MIDEARIFRRDVTWIITLIVIIIFSALMILANKDNDKRETFIENCEYTQFYSVQRGGRLSRVLSCPLEERENEKRVTQNI